MNLSEVDQEIAREPTLYYWEVPGVAAGYQLKKETELENFTRVFLDVIRRDTVVSIEKGRNNNV